MAVEQNIESKETEALAAAVNLSIRYFNCTDDEVGMTGLSVTLPYGDSEFYGYLYPVFTGVGMDADYVGWLEKFVCAEGYNDYYDYESWYEAVSYTHLYTFTDDEAEADIAVVNSCCFIGDAKEESVNTILEMARLKEEGACRALIVTGCLAQRYKQEILDEIPEVDAILGLSLIHI